MSKQDHAARLLKEQLCKKEGIQRKNLLAVSRLCIQTLCDEAGTQGVVEDASSTLNNFCNVLEHIFCHGLKGKKAPGSVENITFWEFIKQACQSVPYNCLAKIGDMDDVCTVRGKGRAWIKMALMEKRLSEYINVALMEETIIKRFYEPCAFLGNEEASILSNVLTALNSVDFSLCLRNAAFDQAIMYNIDYSPFLKYPISDKQLDLEEALLKMEKKQSRVHNDTASTCSGHTSMSEREPVVSAEEELGKLKRSMKCVVDQKVYLEEMLHLKELQCSELNARVMETYEAAEGEKKLSDSIIMELQEQLAEMHLKYRKVQDSVIDRHSDQLNNVEDTGEMESVVARSKYSVSLHKERKAGSMVSMHEGVDVVADMERNGCSRSNSDQSEQGLVRSDQSQHWSTTSVHRSDQSQYSVHRSGSGPLNKVVRSDPNVFRSRSDQSVPNTKQTKQSRSDSGLDRRSVARSPRSKSQSDRRSSTQSDRPDRAFGVTNVLRPRVNTMKPERPRSIVQQKIAGAVEELMPSEKEKLMFAVHKKLHAESIVSFDDPTSSINHC